MPSIVIAATQTPLAEAVFDRLSAYFGSIGYLPDDPAAAAQETAQAEVLVSLIPADFLRQIENRPDLYAALQIALTRSDLLVLAVLVDEAAVPPVTELPSELRALAYTPTYHLQTTPPEALDADMRVIAQEILAHLRRKEEQVANDVPTVPAKPNTQRRSGLPCNVLMIGAILVAAAILVIIPRLRGEGPAQETTTGGDLAVIPGEAGEVLIGLAASLGEDDIRGPLILNGAQLAIDERQTITVDERSFALNLVTQDDACSARSALGIAELYTADPNIAGVIGHTCNISCSAAQEAYTAANYTVISPACDAPGLTDESPNFNRIVPSEAYAGTAAAHIVQDELGFERVAVIHDEIIIGGQLARAFAVEFEGGVTSFNDVLTAELDVPALLDVVLEQDPQLIYFGGRAANAQRIREDLLNRDLEALPLMLADASTAPEFIDLAGDAADGVYTVSLGAPAGDGIDMLQARYSEVYGAAPTMPDYAYAYDAVMMMIEAIEATATLNADDDLVVNRDQLRDYIRSYVGEGVTGPLNCPDDGNCATAEAVTFIIDEGVLTIAEGA